MHGELRLNARHTPKTKTTDEDIETLWQIFDLDGDGSISLEEARLQVRSQSSCFKVLVVIVSFLLNIFDNILFYFRELMLKPLGRWTVSLNILPRHAIII